MSHFKIQVKALAPFPHPSEAHVLGMQVFQ